MAILSQLLATGYGNTQLMLNYNDQNLTAQAFVLSCDQHSPFSMLWWATLAGHAFNGTVRQGTMANQFPISSYNIQGHWIIGRRGEPILVWPLALIGMAQSA